MSKAFLIGAGATRAQYHAPLSDDFFKLLYTSNRDLFDGIARFIGPYEKNKLFDLNVESLMIRSFDFPKPVRVSLTDSLYTAIYEVLAERTERTTEQMIGYLGGRLRKPTTLFKTLLFDDRLQETDCFLTLNYDLYLDRKMLATHKTINYGDENTIFVAHESARKTISLSSKWHFSVYHLHGSLNWENLSNGIAVHAGAIPPRNTRNGCNVCLTPPGMKELSRPLRSIWEVAERRLLDAHELIIIGCSLNPQDKELATLVKIFVARKGADKVKIIYLQDLSNSSLTVHYSQIIGKESKRYPYGFNLNGPRNEQGAIEFIFDEE